MVERILPKELTSNYQGKAIAKWIFAAMVVITIGRSLAHIFLPDGGAQSIATIPLDEFTSSEHSESDEVTQSCTPHE